MADVPLASLLASGQLGTIPAPPPSPEAIRGALTQTLLQRPGDDPIAELSAQRTARADPMAFAMGIIGGPRGMPKGALGAVGGSRPISTRVDLGVSSPRAAYEQLMGPVSDNEWAKLMGPTEPSSAVSNTRIIINGKPVSTR